MNAASPDFVSAAFPSRVMTVEPQWIDYNGHLNMAYYNVLFDRGADDLFEAIGFGPDYVKTRGMSTFAAEVHVCYLRELHAGDEVRVFSQVLDHDAKRMHFYQEIRHVDGWLSATSEGLALHVDMAGPKVAPFPPDIAAAIAGIKSRHAAIGWPERAGRRIGIGRPGSGPDLPAGRREKDPA